MNIIWLSKSNLVFKYIWSELFKCIRLPNYLLTSDVYRFQYEVDWVSFNAATPQPLLIINEHNFPGSKMKSAGPSSSLTWTIRGRLFSRRSSTLSRSPPSPPLLFLFNQSELEGGLGDLGRPGRLDWWNRRWDLQLPLWEAHCSRTDRGEIITELSTTKKWYRAMSLIATVIII